ncbi:MAG: hypothetical protein ACFBZ8_00205 [Opitutales bacterium]
MTERRRHSNRSFWICLSLAVVFNAVGLAVFYFNEDLRKHTYTYVQEPPAPVDRERTRERRKLDPHKIERLAERTEARKKAQLREEVRKLEEVKLEMERHLEAKLRELLAEDDLQLADRFEEVLNEEAAKLLKAVRAESEAVAFKEGRDERVEATLEGMITMEVPAELERFIEGALKTARELGDRTPKLVEKQPAPGEYLDPFLDESFEKIQLPEAKLERLAELSERAEALARKAEALRAAPYEELFQAGAPLEQLQPESIEAMSPNDLYAYAQALEAQIFADVNAHQAADLALVNNSDYEAALEAVSGEPPPRPRLEASLADDAPATSEQLLAYHASLEQAVGEATNMRVSAQSRLNTVQQRTSAGEIGRQLTLARQGLQQASARQGSRGFADYSQPLLQMSQLQSAQGNGAAGSHSLRNSTVDFGSGADMGSGQNRNARLRLPSQRIQRDAMPGRRFTRDSSRQGWLFLDSWYIIGPWQKQSGPITFEQPYPPEAVIDFDAVYAGKEYNGQPIALRWRFLQSDSVRITPYEHTGNSVYYAYTEVYAEEPMDVLLAVASDDGAKIWLNDVVVHQDSGLSPWRLDEGFRKVFLRQGYNRVLLRVENGPSVCHFSVLLCPVEVAEGI